MTGRSMYFRLWGRILLLCTAVAYVGKAQETSLPKLQPGHVVKTASLKRDSVRAERAICGKELAPVDIILTASNPTPEVNEPVTIRLEFTPRIDAPNSRLKFDLIPAWVKIISGDTLWIGDVGKNETVVKEIVVKPTLREVFFVRGMGGILKRGGKHETVKIHVKGAIEVPQRILALRARIASLRSSIEKHQTRLADIKSGKLSQDDARQIYHHPGLFYTTEIDTRQQKRNQRPNCVQKTVSINT